MVDHPALAGQQDVDPSVAEAAPLGGDLLHGRAQFGIPSTAAAIPNARAVDRQGRARPTRAHPVYRAGVSDGFTPCVGRHHFFYGDVLQNGVVQHRLGQQLLETGVLFLECLEPAGFRDVHAAVLGLVLVERGLAQTVLAAHVRRLHPGLVRLEHPDDLFLGEP